LGKCKKKKLNTSLRANGLFEPTICKAKQSIQETQGLIGAEVFA
jgi:hypothetical protein